MTPGAHLEAHPGRRPFSTYSTAAAAHLLLGRHNRVLFTFPAPAFREYERYRLAMQEVQATIARAKQSARRQKEPPPRGEEA